MVPLKLLTPYDTKELTLNLLKDTNVSDSQNKKNRGQIEVELTFVPFKEDSSKFSESLVAYSRKESGAYTAMSDDGTPTGAGLLLVMIHGAEDVDGERHNNPYALIFFRGERKKTKVKLSS